MALSRPTDNLSGPRIESPAGKLQAAALLSLANNVCLVSLKVAAGFASHSISVLAEGIQSSADVLASLLILITVRAASRPPDARHPYGHGKFENLASLAQIALILGSTVYLLSAAWARWRDPVLPNVDWGIAALSVSIIANLAVSARLRRVARETGSQALRAEAAHLWSDLISCVGVLVGLGLVRLTGEPRIDPLVAAGMTIFIFASALDLLRDTVRPLVDERLPAEEEALVRTALNGEAGVRGYHKLRSRRAGSHRLIDVHVLMDDDLTFRAAHALAETVERRIRQALPNADVIVHAEPWEEEMEHQETHHR